ncbi:MAG: DUF805 domain-containing protein [Pseudomonadota bacterium]
MRPDRNNWPYAPPRSIWSWLFRRGGNLVELGSPPKQLERKSSPKSEPTPAFRAEPAQAPLRAQGEPDLAGASGGATSGGKPFVVLLIQALVGTLDWTGRASRREFGAFVAFYFVSLLFAGALTPLLGVTVPFEVWFVLFLTLISVSVRRMHDTGRRGWWVLLGITNPITFLLAIYRLLQPGDPGTNEFGPPPDD